MVTHIWANVYSAHWDQLWQVTTTSSMMLALSRVISDNEHRIGQWFTSTEWLLKLMNHHTSEDEKSNFSFYLPWATRGLARERRAWTSSARRRWRCAEAAGTPRIHSAQQATCANNEADAISVPHTCARGQRRVSCTRAIPEDARGRGQRATERRARGGGGRGRGPRRRRAEERGGRAEQRPRGGGGHRRGFRDGVSFRFSSCSGRYCNFAWFNMGRLFGPSYLGRVFGFFLFFLGFASKPRPLFRFPLPSDSPTAAAAAAWCGGEGFK